MHILFVGGGFFVGYEMLSRLLQEGHELTVIALHRPSEELRPYVEWLPVDRNNASQLCKVLVGRHFDTVIDNVAYNADQLQKLLDALGGRTDRILLTSTVDIYRKADPQLYAEIDGRLTPSDQAGTKGNEHYLRGKRSCELLIRNSGIPWTVIRLAVVTGRRDNQSCAPVRHPVGIGEPSRSLFYPCRILDGGPILLRQDDEAVLNVIWVTDLANAVSLILQTPASLGQTYNVAGDEVWTSEHLVRTLSAVAGQSPDIVHASATQLADAGLSDYTSPYGRGPVWSVVDNEKLSRLGWAPTPPEIWLADLLDAATCLSARPWYERRLREIGLAQRVRRQHGKNLSVWRPQPVTQLLTFARTQGRSALAPVAVDFTATPIRAMTSKVGIGSWMGDTGPETDATYVNAIVHAVSHGINVIDTAINYRRMQGERCVGRALKRLQSVGFDRSGLLVCTKGGFITSDAANNLTHDEYVKRFYADKKLISSTEANRRHSIAPKFIEYSLQQSLNNLCVEHIDVYYLHNPENALEAMNKDAFFEILRDTFTALERAVEAGRIGCYGLATWDGLRLPPAAKKHLSLARTIEVAQSVAGPDHHFRCVQMPYSALEHQAHTEASQQLNGEVLPPLAAAQKLGLYCFTSATLGQGKRLPDSLLQKLHVLAPDLSPQAAMLRFAVGTASVGTALAGMRKLSHVEEAFRAARMPPLETRSLDLFFR